MKGQNRRSLGIPQHILQAFHRVGIIKGNKDTAGAQYGERPQQDILGIGHIDCRPISRLQPARGKRLRDAGAARVQLPIGHLAPLINQSGFFRIFQSMAAHALMEQLHLSYLAEKAFFLQPGQELPDIPAPCLGEGRPKAFKNAGGIAAVRALQADFATVAVAGVIGGKAADG